MQQDRFWRLVHRQERWFVSRSALLKKAKRESRKQIESRAGGVKEPSRQRGRAGATDEFDFSEASTEWLPFQTTPYVCTVMQESIRLELTAFDKLFLMLISITVRVVASAQGRHSLQGKAISPITTIARRRCVFGQSLVCLHARSNLRSSCVCSRLH